MNRYLQRLEHLEQARKLFEEYKWRLQFLRSIPAAPKPDPTDNELLEWFYKLNRNTPLWN